MNHPYLIYEINYFSSLTFLVTQHSFNMIIDSANEINVKTKSGCSWKWELKLSSQIQNKCNRLAMNLFKPFPNLQKNYSKIKILSIKTEIGIMLCIQNTIEYHKFRYVIYTCDIEFSDSDSLWMSIWYFKNNSYSDATFFLNSFDSGCDRTVLIYWGKFKEQLQMKQCRNIPCLH